MKRLEKIGTLGKTFLLTLKHINDNIVHNWPRVKKEERFSQQYYANGWGRVKTY